MKTRVVSVALLLACLAVPAMAAWVSASASTTSGLTVSPGQDISGYVGHVSDSTYQNTSNARGHEALYNARNSGHSFGPATGYTDTGTAYNSVTVTWNSMDSGDGDRTSGGWAVGSKLYGTGQSQVTNGATYDGIYTEWITSIVLTVQTPSGPVTQGNSNLGQGTSNYGTQRLTGNASYNVPEPSWTMVLTNMTSPTTGDFFTAGAGTGSPTTPSV